MVQHLHEAPAGVADTVAGKQARSATAATQQSLVRAREMSTLNAFVTLNEERALADAHVVDHAEALPLLRGITLAVKDNIHVAGLPNSAGTASLRSFVPNDTSPVVARLQELGAVVLGKAGLHELAYGVTSVNYAFGPIRNPIDQAKTPGGSSGGSAAAVAAGIVTAGIGTDTGGSIRLPAAMTGTVGFRPTTGTYSGDGVTLISNTRDTVGLITRSVADVALLHGLLTHRATVKPRPIAGLRIGVPRKHFRECLDPDVEQVFSRFLLQLESLGVCLVSADLEDVPQFNEETGFPVCLYETGELLPAYLRRYETGLTFRDLVDSVQSPDVASVLQAVMGGAVTEQAYRAALEVSRPRLQQAYASYFRKHRVEAVIFPTSPITARDIEGLVEGVWVNGAKLDTFQTYIRNTDPASNAGIPAISIPAGVTRDGLPVGVELECPVGADNSLLSIALGIERAFDPTIRSASDNGLETANLKKGVMPCL